MAEAGRARRESSCSRPRSAARARAVATAASATRCGSACRRSRAVRRRGGARRAGGRALGERDRRVVRASRRSKPGYRAAGYLQASTAPSLDDSWEPVLAELQRLGATDAGVEFAPSRSPRAALAALSRRRLLSRWPRPCSRPASPPACAAADRGRGRRSTSARRCATREADGGGGGRAGRRATRKPRSSRPADPARGSRPAPRAHRDLAANGRSPSRSPTCSRRSDGPGGVHHRLAGDDPLLPDDPGWADRLRLGRRADRPRRHGQRPRRGRPETRSPGRGPPAQFFPGLEERRSTTPGAGRSMSRRRHLPIVRTLGARVHCAGFGYTGNGVGPSRHDRPHPGLAGARAPRRLHLAGARRSAAGRGPAGAVPLRRWQLIRRAILRKERIEEQERRAGPVTRRSAGSPSGSASTSGASRHPGRFGAGGGRSYNGSMARKVGAVGVCWAGLVLFGLLLLPGSASAAETCKGANTAISASTAVEAERTMLAWSTCTARRMGSNRWRWSRSCVRLPAGTARTWSAAATSVTSTRPDATATRRATRSRPRAAAPRPRATTVGSARTSPPTARASPRRACSPSGRTARATTPTCSARATTCSGWARGRLRAERAGQWRRDRDPDVRHPGHGGDRHRGGSHRR